ncbi:MAG TPA: 4-(cytidine 5'-diphospho)-2-C-methyl-D-erythritol kinase [Chitinophagaceae bacterium]|nr:4-(cytidine 5'-diphospho)-2-C-methyl-D-erythritol kinase [Chitinophagaceae bacterium]
MIVFPNCKINLGLDILRKRPDGYHDLQTVFYPVPYTDMLEFVVATEFRFTTSGNPIPSDQSSNLCVKAYHLMREKFPDLPAVHMHLHKKIPMGAGLGGGSSDGAFALSALNRHFQKQLSAQELIEMSLKLGSDCPFFMVNAPVVAYGRGEVMEPVPVSLSGYTLVMVHPDIHVSTKDAFSGIVPRDAAENLKQRITEPVETWKNWLFNQFEETVGAKHPEIMNIKARLYELGAVYASMSGSGSVVFGLFRDKPSFPVEKEWNTITVKL